MWVMEFTENQLVTILLMHRHQIADLWVNLILQLPDSHYQCLHSDELRQSCLTGIDALLVLQAHDSESDIEEYLRRISLTRLEQGFDIREVIQALLLLHRAVLLVANLHQNGETIQVLKVCLDLDDSLRLMVSQFGALYSSAMNRSLEEQQQQARTLAQENAFLYQETQQRLEESMSMQRVTSALLQGRTLAEVLNVVCNNAISLIRAKGSTVFLLNNDDLLHVAYSLGYGEPAFETMPVGGSFTGIAITSGKAVFTNQPQEEMLWYGNTIDESTVGGIQSLLATPLTVRGKIIGALVVINKEQPFNQDDLRTMGLFADQAAIAIENSRLTQEVERIAVMEERNRLARDLHDSITQSLYGVSLYAEAAARRLTSGDTLGVEAYIRELKITALDALKEMRLLIFELRPPVLEKEGLEAALQARLDAVEGRAGLKTELNVTIGDRLPGNIEDAFYRIAQEALNNVLKHAQARRVIITLTVDPHRAILEVNDDGSGFLVDEAPEKGGIGIKGMFERVERLGGRLTISSAPGEGTRVQAEVCL